MAILSKIRDRSMFLILIVGLALFAFVLDPSSIQSFFSSSKINAVGQVNGEDIDREEFAREVEAYMAQNNNKVSQIQAVNAVWNTLVSEKVFEDQLEEAGIVIGEKDIWDEMISLPQIQNSPMFKNEIGLFDEEKLKEYIASLEDEAQSGNPEAWYNWLLTEKSIKQNLEREAYTNLVTAGIGATLREGEREYEYNNTKMDADFVYLPYSTIPDSLATLSKDEIKAYVEKNLKRFKPEASRTIKYVRFNIEPSEEDQKAIEESVASLIEDREEYSNAAKTTVKVAGLKNATDYEAFLSENKSDLSLDTSYKYKNQVAADIADAVFEAKVGDVVGPYKQNGYFKISKITEIVSIPDSVKSSHIIIPYAGSTRSTSTKTKDAAKKSADSIYRLVRNNKSKFEEVANEINTDGTKGKGGDLGWIRKNQAFSAGFDRDFADYIYKNKKGSIDVVETAFGFHIIRIDDQTKAEKAVSLATFARLIEASEVTENATFEKAETLAANLADGKDLEELAQEIDYSVQTAQSLKPLDENVPGLGKQRQIVNWAFENGRELKDSRRFDVEVNGKRGYAVAVLYGMTDENTLAINSDILLQVRPELTNKKKAEMLKEKLSGTTLEEMAKSAGVNMRKAANVVLASPLISGVGNEPAVVGAMSTLPLNEISEVIEGEKGIFVIKVTKREPGVALDNYDSYRKNLATRLKGRTYQLYQVLVETADVDDNRSRFY